VISSQPLKPDYSDGPQEEKATPTTFSSKNDRMLVSCIINGSALSMVYTLVRLTGFIFILMAGVVPRDLWAEDPISIQQILDEPQIYHLRHVTLHGTVRDVQALDPYMVADGKITCYGAYLFRLEDDTSTIPVAVLGICGKPLIRNPEVEDGDRVEVLATIQAPSHGGYYLSFRGLKVVTEQEGVVQAVADRILPLQE
jgi:hypothetical protein